MVLMSLFAGQQWELRHRQEACGCIVGKERVGQIERVAWKHTHITICKIGLHCEFAV